MDVIKPPSYDHDIDSRSIFLAGSIEMGAAENWQETIEKSLMDQEGQIFNPRRDNWDSSWEQSITNPNFRGQVEWELNHLDQVSVIPMYFDPNTKSPITLLELGIYATETDNRLIVCCPEGFWRKGNVDIVCRKYDIAQVDTLDGLIQRTLHEINNLR